MGLLGPTDGKVLGVGCADGAALGSVLGAAPCTSRQHIYQFFPPPGDGSFHNIARGVGRIPTVLKDSKQSWSKQVSIRGIFMQMDPVL